MPYKQRKVSRGQAEATPPTEPPRIYTVNQFCDRNRAFSVGSVRWLIFNEHTNGLHKSGAIVRLGRKVLIDEACFFAWLKTQSS